MLDIIVMTTYLDGEKEGQQLDIDEGHLYIIKIFNLFII